VTLYYAKAHLKTKRCKELQNLLCEAEKNMLHLKFSREVNEIKSNLLLDKRDEAKPAS
jgi:hypothetical protein